MSAVPERTVEQFTDGAHRVVDYREVGGRLVRAEYVDRSRCYTSGEWIVAAVFTTEGWKDIVKRESVPTAKRGYTSPEWDLWTAQTAIDEVLNEAEKILAFTV